MPDMGDDPMPLRKVADLRPIYCPHGVKVAYRDTISRKRWSTGKTCQQCRDDGASLEQGA